MSNGKLKVVATPIGNLEDISLRALDALRQADLIAAEDTRHTKKLLARHGVATPLLALHEHNEAQKAPELVRRMRGGEVVALVSDAGTPLISDPGFRLVRLAIEAGIPVTPLPGASAVIAALCVSGLPTDEFVFAGFLPPKTAARRTRLDELCGEARTLVIFESSHRIVASLRDLAGACGPERPAALCRELTKQFETVLRGSLSELAEAIEGDALQQKGEFVIVVAGREQAAEETLAAGLEMAQALLDYLPASQAAKVAAKLTGAPRRAIYEIVGKQVP